MTPDDDLGKWESRYRAQDYRPDREPTPFLVDAAGDLTPGAALCLAAGAGRNAVYLAEAGWRVTAADISPAGLAWCRRLAAERRVEVETVAADLTTWDPGKRTWELVTMVSYYEPRLFPGVRRAVRPGGHFLLHTFTTAQLDQGWGPSSAQHLARPEEVRAAFGDWEAVRFDPGVFPRPDGRGEALVRMLARRPIR